MTLTRRLLFLGLLLGLWLSGKEVLADTPTEQIQETIKQVLMIVSASAAASDVERREALRGALMPRFDFLEMAKRSLGKHWNRVSARQEEFVAAFAGFLGNSYVGQIGSYKDEKIQFVREWTEKEFAEVDTKVVPSKGEPVSVNYRLHRVQGNWKIYDVVIEQISLVNNYRSQFNRILANGSFDDLLNQLKQKGSQRGN